MAVLVVSHEDVAFWKSGRWKEQLRWDAGKCVYLVWRNVDELRRSTAGRATATRNVRSAVVPDDILDHPQPGGESPSIEGRRIVHVDFTLSRYSRVACGFDQDCLTETPFIRDELAQ
jgi:hypothetical protein